MNTNSLNRLQVATARHHTYQLLSKLFLGGMTAELQPWVDQIPLLAEVCSRPFDADQCAAEHQHIFSYDLYPFESIFRDPSGLLGGQTTNQIEALYRQAAYASGDEPGHIGHELAFLAHLCQAEASAFAANEIVAAKHYANYQAVMLSSHLLQWFPALHIALTHSTNPFYAALGQVTLELISEHAQCLHDARKLVEFEGSLPAPPDISNDPHTNLKGIAQFLITPPLSGFHLGREAITKLARSAQLPRGFGGRHQMLANLLYSASQYNAIATLLAEIASLAQQWREEYQQQQEMYSHLAPWIRQWQDLVSKTAISLLAMEKMVHSLA